MSSVLTDLRAALEAYEAAKAAAGPIYYMVDSECVETYQRLVRVLFGNRAALLDVAEAAHELCHGGTFPRLQAALASLVKEADHDRA